MNGMPDMPPPSTDPHVMGLRLQRICEMCEAHRRSISPAERDESLQIAIAQGSGPAGRFRTTLMLFEFAHAIMQQRQQVGNTEETA